MATMAAEKPLDCTTTPCGGTCGAGKAELFKTSCSDGSFQRRCCTASNYPDVMVMVDKGMGSTLTYRYYQGAQNMVYADYSLLETPWTSTKTLKALPGGQPAAELAPDGACSWSCVQSCMLQQLPYPCSNWRWQQWHDVRDAAASSEVAVVIAVRASRLCTCGGPCSHTSSGTRDSTQMPSCRSWTRPRSMGRVWSHAHVHACAAAGIAKGMLC
jgi:hypothetical protein